MKINTYQYQTQRLNLSGFHVHKNIVSSTIQTHHQYHLPLLPPNSPLLPSLEWRSATSRSRNHFWSSKVLVSRCVSEKFSDSFEPNPGLNYVPDPNQTLDQKQPPIIQILKESNSLLPYVVLASALLALFYPPSFTWFTSRYYAPALGFLMFAVGVNSSEKDFLEAINRPAAIFAGYVGQFVLKPLLGYLFGLVAVSIFGLPTPIGAGIMLVSCVSGAQLSNYATFLTHPPMAPLSIVMTSLSSATAVFITPLLSLLLIGKRLPVDVRGMVFSITQIVVAPIAVGLLLNRFFPRISNAIRPFLPPLSVIVTALCVGAPLAINIESVMSPFGVTILLLISAFHISAFVAGYISAGLAFAKAPDVKALQRTLSFETGMQSSLLALALANRFFQDPLVSVPPAISVDSTISKITKKNKKKNRGHPSMATITTLTTSLKPMNPTKTRATHVSKIRTLAKPSYCGIIGDSKALVGLFGASLALTLAPPTLALELPLLQLSEPANALSLPTWAIHVSSVVEWITAMALVWQYGEKSGFESWKGLSWGMVPLLGGAFCACTWHFFYNSESLEVLVALQGALTLIGNATMCIAAFRIYKSSKERSQDL
ncbi:SBF domain-containing protein/DUF2499 domain-containing protein [Cephalotus follicularis]|uniref:SBF domain-containing protein/DUF2499 domain-containing protein n=1 Tax=Cephalotus follicularis TaxID=3775 RepID=A0A1Q3D3C1_CEPFO|nr:SBF domain-containing protein/DUF2499 domain-containing protein [Cephalotus follicularis]